MRTYERITDLVGGTPLLQLNAYMDDEAPEATVLGKLEYFNPAGSVKDTCRAVHLKRCRAPRTARPRHRHYRTYERQYRHRAGGRRRAARV